MNEWNIRKSPRYIFFWFGIILGLAAGILLENSLEASRDKELASELWGNGNPDPNHIKYFGNDNLSRLCYVQTQRINQQAAIINQLVALNAKQHKILGESDIRLFDRVRKLEDPND